MIYLKTGILIIILASFTACGTTDSIDEEGPPRTIVFSAQNDEEGTFQIFSMREDGSGVRQLTDGEFSSVDPAWSPDGIRIAYARSTGSTAGDALWVMDADGSNKEPLVVNPQTGSPQLGNHTAWSPDGTKLAFDRCLDCEFGGKNVDIFVADLQTGAVDTLTDHPVGDSHPTWSPDGRRIAFTSNRDYFDADSMRFRRELYMIDSDGKNLIRLTDTGKVTVPKWSPDEKYIAYSWQRLDPDIYLFDLDSKKIIELTNLKFVGAPMWNHDGSQLLISGTTNESIRVFQLITTDKKLLKETVLDFKDLESTRNFDWYNRQ